MPPRGTGTLLGIDVSGHQPSISWPAVKRAGISFGWVKATEGQTFDDRSHKRHRREARRAGIPLGAYHFARPDTDISSLDPVAQADHFLEVARPAEGDLLPVLDLETPGLPPARLARWAKAWLRRVERAIDQPPILYTFPSYWTDRMGNSKAFGRYPLWLASYGPDDGRVHPARKIGGWESIAVHQYTSKGRIEGFTGQLDLNRLMRGTKLEDLTLGETPPLPAPRFGKPWRSSRGARSCTRGLASMPPSSRAPARKHGSGATSRSAARAATEVAGGPADPGLPTSDRATACAPESPSRASSA